MNQQTDKKAILEPDDSLPSYDGAKLPSLKPKVEPYSILDTRPIKTIDTWMSCPSVSGCPPGLEYLTEIDKLLFIKDHDRKERKIKYHIKNNSGENVYTAVEDYDMCCFICCNITRPFEVKVLDYQEREVLHLHRPLRSKSCCFPCCLQSVKVTASGTLCGFIKQSWHPFRPKFRICDASGNTVLLIEGPSGTNYAGLAGPAGQSCKFRVLLHDGITEAGFVSKLLASVIRESFPKEKHFSISFPLNLDVNIKAVLLAASILIDSMYFKTKFRTINNNVSAQSYAFSTGFECGYCLAMCLLQ